MLDWQRLYYGISNPSKARRIFIHAFVVLCALAIYGFFTNFVVTDFGAMFGLVASAISTGGLTFLIWKGTLKGDETYCDRTLTHEKRGGSLTFVPVFLFIVFWLIFSRSVPNLYASVWGDEASAHVYMTKSHSYSRRMCRYRVEGSYVKYPPWHICVSEADFHRLPERGEMRVSGRETTFGLQVTSVTPIDFDTDL